MAQVHVLRHSGAQPQGAPWACGHHGSPVQQHHPAEHQPSARLRAPCKVHNLQPAFIQPECPITPTCHGYSKSRELWSPNAWLMCLRGFGEHCPCCDAFVADAWRDSPVIRLCCRGAARMADPDPPRRAALAAHLRCWCMAAAAAEAGKGTALLPSGPEAPQVPGCPRRAGPCP